MAVNVAELGTIKSKQIYGSSIQCFFQFELDLAEALIGKSVYRQLSVFAPEPDYLHDVDEPKALLGYRKRSFTRP